MFKIFVSTTMINMYPHTQDWREEVVRRCSVKPVLPKISKNSEENTEVSFDKDAELQCDFLAKMFLQILQENPFIEHLRRLFMKKMEQMQIVNLKVSLTSNEPRESLVIKKETVKTNATLFQTLHYFPNFYLGNIPNVC